MAGIYTSPSPSPYPIEKVGDSPYPYPYPYPVNAGIPHQNGDRFGQYPRGRVYLPSLPMRWLMFPSSISFTLAKKNNNIKMSDIYMAKIKIIIFINTKCVSMFFSLFLGCFDVRQVWPKWPLPPQDKLYCHIICHYFHLFFSFFHIIVSLQMTKCLFEISFMTMKIWIKCCYIHFWEQIITNLVSWMLLHSLLGMKHNQSGLMIFYFIKTHCFFLAIRRHSNALFPPLFRVSLRLIASRCISTFNTQEDE